MALPEVSNAPSLDVATSYTGAIKQGVNPFGLDGAFIDAYNQAKIAKYNNDYNYWLWQQQAEYNNPSNQVARLKAAGLNPNFNSIDGTGNLGSMPTSSSTMTPSIGRNKNMIFQQILGAANTALSAFTDGVASLSKLSDLPPLSRIGEYRNLLVDLGSEQLKGSRLHNFIKTVDGIAQAALSGFDVSGLRGSRLWTENLSVPGGDTSITFDPDKMLNVDLIQKKLDALGLDIDIKNIVKDTKQYYKDNIQPHEKAIKEGQAGKLSSGQLFSKIANGEKLSAGQWIVAILQYISDLISLKPLF